MNKLNEFISSKQGKRVSLGKLWQQYIAVNQSVNGLCIDIGHWSTFWSASLTVLFTGFITLQCYLFYIVTFVPTLPFIWRSYFISALFNWTMFQVSIIKMCSNVVKCNSAIERANRKFYLAFFCASVLKPNAEMLEKTIILKAELLQNSHRLRPYCMVLLDNYRITSKTFYMVCVWMFWQLNLLIDFFP